MMLYQLNTLLFIHMLLLKPILLALHKGNAPYPTMRRCLSPSFSLYIAYYFITLWYETK